MLNTSAMTIDQNRRPFGYSLSSTSSSRKAGVGSRDPSDVSSLEGMLFGAVSCVLDAMLDGDGKIDAVQMLWDSPFSCRYAGATPRMT